MGWRLSLLDIIFIIVIVVDGLLLWAWVSLSLS